MPAKAPGPQHVRRGSLEVAFDANGTFAREVRLDGEEIFRGIGFVVRDANWGTPALDAAVEIKGGGDRAEARSQGQLDSAGSDLDWEVVWTVTESGLEARARFSSSKGFLTNRTGFVVLHGLGATRNRPVTVTHSDGRREETRFPDLVSPHQPFFDIAGLDYETAAGIGVDLAFEGEVFEIEDQRNWTDASYKTYCRPLGRPFPYRIEPGSTVEQVVSVTLTPSDKGGARASDEQLEVSASAPFPLLGTSLQPGPLHVRAREALAALAPGFTAIELDLDGEGWLEEARARITAAPGAVRIDLRKADRARVLAAVNALGPLLAGRRVVGLSLWDADDATIEAARKILGGVEIGAGTGAFFTELNRMKEVPETADYLTWTSNPTVHGFDDDTIGETTEPLFDILRTAKDKFPGRRFQVGPMTLGLRFNPNATTAEGRRQASPADPRQGTMIAAAWLGATLAGLIDERVEALSFFEAAGPKGLVDDDGRTTPSGHLLTRLARVAGRGATVLRWPQFPRAAGILIDAPGGATLCLVHARHDGARLALPPGRWGRREVLAEDGFVAQGAGGESEVEMTGFSVHWLLPG